MKAICLKWGIMDKLSFPVWYPTSKNRLSYPKIVENDKIDKWLKKANHYVANSDDIRSICNDYRGYWKKSLKRRNGDWEDPEDGGRIFCERISFADPFRLPVELFRIKLGMSIAVGQASIQGAS